MRNFFIASLALLVLAACAATSSDGADPADQPRPDVELGDSFMIPDAQISHTPGVLFTQDLSRMLTATAGGDLVVFEASSRKLLNRIRVSEETTNAVSMEGSGKFAAWGLAKGGLVVVEVSTGKTIARQGSGTVSSVSVSPEGRRIAVARGKDLEIYAFPALTSLLLLP